MSSSRTVDDNDEAMAFSGGWTMLSNAAAYSGSLHSTTQSGANANLFFDGNQAAVYGYLPLCLNPTSTYVTFAIDGNTVASLFLACPSSARSNVLFYTTPMLADGVHQITITNSGSGTLQLDRIDTSKSVTTTPPPDPPASSSSSTTHSIDSTPTTGGGPSSSEASSSLITSDRSSSSLTGSNSVAPTATVVTINGQVTSMRIAPAPTGGSSSSSSGSGDNSNPLDGPSSSGDPSSPDTPSSSPPIGPIVGGILGLLFIILLVLLFIRCRNRRKHAAADTEKVQVATVDPKGGVTPFEVSFSSGPSEQLTSPTSPESSTVLRRPTLVAMGHNATVYPSEKAQDQELSMLSNDTPVETPQSDVPIIPNDEKDSEGLGGSSSHIPPRSLPRSLPQLTTLSSSPLRTSLPPLAISRPTSSILGSDIAPAYVRDPNRPHYRSGMTIMTLGTDTRASAILDVPPSYESVRNADVGPSSV